MPLSYNGFGPVDLFEIRDVNGFKNLYRYRRKDSRIYWYFVDEEKWRLKASVVESLNHQIEGQFLYVCN